MADLKQNERRSRQLVKQLNQRTLNLLLKGKYYCMADLLFVWIHLLCLC